MRKTIIVLAEHLDLDSNPLLNPPSLDVVGVEVDLERKKRLGFDATGSIPILKAALDRKMVAVPAPPPTLDNSGNSNPSPAAIFYEQLSDMIRDLEYLFLIFLSVFAFYLSPIFYPRTAPPFAQAAPSHFNLFETS